MWAWLQGPLSAQGSQASTALGTEAGAWVSSLGLLWGGRLGRGGQAPHLEEGSGSLKAHMGHRHPLAARQVGVARADASEGGEGQDPRSQWWVRGVGPVHLVRVAECPASGQWIHNLGRREEVSTADRAPG